MRLKNKSALITGGTSGIGLATAKLFIAEGARVAVTGRDDSVFEHVKAELGEHALVLKGDVRSIQDMRAIAADVNAQFGGLDVVFANAGWAFPSAVDDIDDKLYGEIMDDNVIAEHWRRAARVKHVASIDRREHARRLARNARRAA